MMQNNNEEISHFAEFGYCQRSRNKNRSMMIP
jgi:hypothetical protein